MTYQTNLYIIRNVIAIAETPEALRVEFPHEDRQWIPVKVIGKLSDVKHTGDVGSLVVKRDWARNQGWI